MPLFTVNCQKHGQHEVLVDKIEDATCPECGGKVERVWSDAGNGVKFEFRTAGFYSTDYSTGKYRLH